MRKKVPETSPIGFGATRWYGDLSALLVRSRLFVSRPHVLAPPSVLQISMGHLKRIIADKITVPSDTSSQRHHRCHKLAVTAVALTSDDKTVYSVSKDGSIVELDVETGKRHRLVREVSYANSSGGGAPWLAPAATRGSRTSLLAATVSTDGSYLAVGGGDKKVHIFDTRSRTCIKSFGGHKDEVSALAFRQGTHQLFSASLVRSIDGSMDRWIDGSTMHLARCCFWPETRPCADTISLHRLTEATRHRPPPLARIAP